VLAAVPLDDDIVPVSVDDMAEEAAMSLAGAAEFIAPVVSAGGVVVAVASDAAVVSVALFFLQAEAVSAMAPTAATVAMVRRVLGPIQGLLDGPRTDRPQPG
jgi:hypothetical protein